MTPGGQPHTPWQRAEKIEKGGGFPFWLHPTFPWVSPPFYSSFSTMNLRRIPLLCKERLGEGESWCPREAMRGSIMNADKRLPPLAYCIPQSATVADKGGERKGNQP